MRTSIRGLSVLVVSALVVGMAGADGPVQSGLKVGEYPPPFQVDDITGPNKGTTLCYR